MRTFTRSLIACLAGIMMLHHTTAADAPTTRSPSTRPSVYVDSSGVIRWSADDREASFFGANYCLPSACDYRAAGYVGADRKKLIEQDMQHFARMGFDGMRVCLWGDWENCDEAGNLIDNDHLDLMDYLIAQATRRGIYMLFTPITTYSSLWPDLQDDPNVRGFSRHFQKSELGTNPQAIAAQVNYLKQILNHVNRYTGVAVKDEPNILFIEMINEPWHHSDDYEGSVRYINALVDAVKSTGCTKLTFHNISQDFGMARAIHDSNVDGSSFAWYPSGLNAGHELHGNFLRFADTYPHMTEPLIASKPRIVYEFDMPDVISGYHYPAMARTFRQVGAQWATMFSYDMLATAPYNLGWHTHLLNLVYTPKKAASAIIAGEVMRRLPRMESYGDYPANTKFGDFRVSYEPDLAELVTRDAFMYSNNTQTAPPAPDELKRIVGFGSSPIVSYQGQGIYFLDRIDDGRWRLEVYPDSVRVADPFDHPSLQRPSFKLVGKLSKMTIRLPALGESFTVEPLNEGNSNRPRVSDRTFAVLPGVYLLKGDRSSDAALPEKIDGVGMREFVCPAADATAPTAAATETATTDRANRVTLFDAPADFERFGVTREGWTKPTLVAGDRADARAFVVDYPKTLKWVPEDFSRSMFIGDRIASAGEAIDRAKTIWITLRAHTESSTLHIVLIDKDGAAFVAAVHPKTEWMTVQIPLAELKPTRWAMLPQAFPGGMPYWASMMSKTSLDLRSIERLELSLQKSDVSSGDIKDFGVDVQSIFIPLNTQ